MTQQVGPQERYGLQMLRAVAALAVVIHHTLEQSNGAKTAFSPDWLTTFGASGVDIFFVISGFIMLYTSFRPARAPIGAATFLFRRATRIYPLYWVCCLIMLAIMAAGFMRQSRLTPSEIALSFALLPSAKLVIGVSWTLIYEAYFYMVFAVTLLFRSALLSAIGTTALIAIVGLMGSALGNGALQTFFANPITYEFALGLWVAVAFTRPAPAGRRWVVSAFWAIPGFVFLALAPLIVAHHNTNGLPGWPRVWAWGLPSALIVAALLSIAAPTNRFQRLMVLLGDASYAVYLTHPFVMIGYGLILRAKVVSNAPQIAVVPVVVLLAIAVGVGAHTVVENPLLRLIRRWTRREPLVSEGVPCP